MLFFLVGLFERQRKGCVVPFSQTWLAKNWLCRSLSRSGRVVVPVSFPSCRQRESRPREGLPRLTAVTKSRGVQAFCQLMESVLRFAEVSRSQWGPKLFGQRVGVSVCFNEVILSARTWSGALDKLISSLGVSSQDRDDGQDTKGQSATEERRPRGCDTDLRLPFFHFQVSSVCWCGMCWRFFTTLSLVTSSLSGRGRTCLGCVSRDYRNRRTLAIALSS